MSFWDSLPRPLDPVRSIKLKLSILLGVSWVAGLAVFRYWIGWVPPFTSITAVAVAIAIGQVLAHGMTSPLREMTAAARAMARGDYSRRVRATSRDEVGQLAVAFNSMAAELATADQQRRELIANVSHELRTPITAIQAVLENVMDGVADPDTLKTALANTERLGRLVTELLDLSRIDAGVQPLHRAELPLPDLLDSAVEESRVSAAAAGRDVRLHVTAPDETVYADRERLTQVLVNLLDNAVRHSPAGGRVDVRAYTKARDSVIEVADEGPGIPVEERLRVFERFTRGQRATGGGTGLGLAIAYWVVELHGGSIGVVDSARGCVIRVTLPPAPPAL
ncbi:two-component sensor histidine kinase [Virgisporangium aliadipatigenens]|uniref:Signal transduction histidine-protein kinase/phosphatase MprB n=1 Tax=Virgisporangium aliadipatigenens TaxID=741659 RepID=A0A8J4DVT1_9ACTN|nr:HAMP domain-containing sensor histidine kinase [Virgisporangium aliadipatigenens]GIJ51493.1 two-component sensor histidine kinase [Virgisporangium aliadipatigenens]